MFTGLVDHIGLLLSVQKISDGLRSSIRLGLEKPFVDARLGESIALDGVCLTVSQCAPSFLLFDVSYETIQKTIVSHYSPGDCVHLERALCIGERLGGHFVTGHVDGTATVHSNTEIGAFHKLILGGFGQETRPLLILKGSLTVNGVSLTINQVTEDPSEPTQTLCECMIVPHTAKKTRLSTLTAGALVNIEFDLITKIVAQQLPLVSSIHSQGATA